MMGMLDIARILGNQTALAVLKDATPWFRQFLDGIDDDNLAHMVNIEETGGAMGGPVRLHRLGGRPVSHAENGAAGTV